MEKGRKGSSTTDCFGAIEKNLKYKEHNFLYLWPSNVFDYAPHQQNSFGHVLIYVYLLTYKVYVTSRKNMISQIKTFKST